MTKAKILCITKNENTVSQLIQTFEKLDYSFSDSFKNANHALTERPADIIIFEHQDSQNFWSELSCFKNRNFQTPFVALIAKTSVQGSHRLGLLGIEYIVEKNNILNLRHLISNIAHNPIFIILEEHGINRKNISYWSKKFIEILNLHHFESENIAQIADRLGITPSKLIYQVRKDIGCTPKKLIVFLKIHSAIQQMRNPNLQLADISRNIGYNNEKSLNKLFNRYLGLPPLKVRDEILNNNDKNILQSLTSIISIN